MKIVSMKFLLRYTHVLLALVGWAGQADGHGINLSVNYDSGSVPISFNIVSQESALYQEQDPQTGPANMFLEMFASPGNESNGIPPDGTYYLAIGGFAQTAGAWPQYTATYDIVSPLLFSNGVGTGSGGTGPALAEPAATGTPLRVYNRHVGDVNYPGAAAGEVLVGGLGVVAPPSGYGVSLLDTHEMEKDLYIGAGPTNGAYGFAFTVTAHFPGTDTTLTSGRMVNIFALPDFGQDLSESGVELQTKATPAIYDALMLVPEPSSVSLMMIGLAALGLQACRRRPVDRMS